MTRQIALTSGDFAFVDDDDYERASMHNWCMHKSVKYPYTNINIGKGRSKRLFLHRFIMNAKKGQIIDHVDGNVFNASKQNLRFCTKGQNSQNRGLSASNTSGHKGVCWDEARQKWAVQISVNGKRVYWSRFDTYEEAVEAHEREIVKIHGEFARLEWEDRQHDYFLKWTEESLLESSARQLPKSPGRLILPEMVVEISMSKGQFVFVDLISYEDVCNRRWTADYNPHTDSYYARANETIGVKKHKNIKMHRVLMNAQTGDVVDHVNGFSNWNTLDNLRVVDHTANAMNHSFRKDNTSGHTGVQKYNNTDRWLARIRVNGKLIRLGIFEEFDDAVAAYEKARGIFHGEYARRD